MSLEFGLEKYPIRVKSRNGLDCEVRPLQSDDRERIKDLCLAIPEHERLFIKDRMSDCAIFQDWCENIDHQQNLTLLVLHEDKVVAEGNLHQRRGGWKSHIGLVSVLTHPDYRNVGMSQILLMELVEMARHAGLTRLEAEFNGERTIAIHTFALAGFTELVRLPEYVRDFDPKYHDYVLMGRKITTEEEFSGVG